MRLWSRLIRVALLALLVLAFVPLQRVYAAIPARKCSFVDGGFDGYQQGGRGTSANSYEGVSADIIVEDGTLCTVTKNQPYRQTLSWVMIAGGAGSHDAWAQVGWIRRSNVSYPEWFSQYNAGGTLSGRYQYNISAQFGTQHFFRVKYNPTTGYLYSTIDSTAWDHSPFNPFSQSSWGSVPFNPQYYDEANDEKTYVPGTSTDPVVFTSVEVQRFSDDQFASIPCILGAGSSQTNWHHQMYGCTAWHLWATP